MNKPEPIKERLPKPPPAFSTRTTSDRPPESTSRGEESSPSDDFYPKYVHLPSWRQRGAGPRNLGWGVGLVFLGAVLLGVGLYFAGPRAVIPVGIAFATATLLFVVARARVFRQRNGSFLAAALVFVLGTALALVEHGWTVLERTAHAEQLRNQNEPATVATVATPPAKNATPDAAQPLVEAFKIQPPAKNVQRVKVLKDSRVVIDDKAYLIRAGDEFALLGTANGEVRFAAGDQQIALPSDLVEISGPSGQPGQTGDQPAAASANAPQTPKTPAAPTAAQLTERAQREAIRRYPALGVKDSPENQLFIETYQGLKSSGATDFFERPDWPLRLAESLAQKEGWRREDLPADQQQQPPGQAAPAGSTAPAEAAPESTTPAPASDAERSPTSTDPALPEQ